MQNKTSDTKCALMTYTSYEVDQAVCYVPIIKALAT